MGKLYGTKLKELIDATGLSESEWARHHGFSQRAVNSWITGNRNCLLKNALKVAAALNCQLNEISNYKISNQIGDEDSGLYYFRGDIMNMDFLIEKRKEKFLTQEEVARTLGMGKASYQKIEVGINNLHPKHWKKIASLLDISESDITKFAALVAVQRRRKRVASNAKWDNKNLNNTSLSCDPEERCPHCGHKLKRGKKKMTEKQLAANKANAQKAGRPKIEKPTD